MFYLKQTTQRIYVRVTEGDTDGKQIQCQSMLPVICSSSSVTSCDLQIYLNYRNTSSYNRIVQKRCDNINGVYTCEGCSKGFKKNPSNDASLNKVTWTLSASFESGNLNYRNEIYNIDIFSNKNSSSLRPFWKNITLPYITVNMNLLFDFFYIKNYIKIILKFEFIPYNRPLYVGAQCFNDPHCKTFDNTYFELQQPGEFLMFENTKLSTRVFIFNFDTCKFKTFYFIIKNKDSHVLSCLFSIMESKLSILCKQNLFSSDA